jgi:hypothetical protein
MTAPTTPGQIIESVITRGDLAKLTAEERTRYYSEVCRSVGLNPMTQPFQYIELDGKLTLYARKDATDQLRQIHGISLTIVSREQVGDVYVVTARATTASGRVDESIGAVPLTKENGEWKTAEKSGKRYFQGNGTSKPLTHDAMANALMKCETKAKRRVTLSICGLGLLDETELETIPGAQPEPMPVLPAKKAPRAIAAAPAPAEGQSGFTRKHLRSAIDAVGEALEDIGAPISLLAQTVEIIDSLAGYDVADALILQGIAKMTGQTLTDLSTDSIALLSPQEMETLIQRYGKRLEQLEAERAGQPDRQAFDEPTTPADDIAGPQF